MSVKTHHFRIGLFVLAGGLLLIGALFALGLKSYFGKRHLFETYVMGKVENLSVGALVTLRGVTIGKVSSIEFIGDNMPIALDAVVNKLKWNTERIQPPTYNPTPCLSIRKRDSA